MTREKLREILATKKWKPTTTFETFPHSYSLDFEWRSQDSFKECWNFVNDNGEERIFYRRKYRYYKLDGYDYWAMHTHNKKGIINRVKLDD